MIKRGWINCVRKKKEKKDFFAISVFRTPLPFHTAQLAAPQRDYQKETLLIWTSFIHLVNCGWLFTGPHICKKHLSNCFTHCSFPFVSYARIFLKYPLNTRLFLLSPAGPEAAWQFQRDLAHTCEFQNLVYRLLLLPQTWSLLTFSSTAQTAVAPRTN